jgi:hypothetical protein
VKLQHFVFALLLLVTGGTVQAQNARSATDRAALLHWYEQSLNERASQEARELAHTLNLNESETQLIRQFAAARIDAETQAQAYIINDPERRREATAQAAAQFQTRLVNVLNETQMQIYLQLLADKSRSQSSSTGVAQLTTAAEEVVAPATSATPAGATEASPAEAAAAPATKTRTAAKYTPKHRYNLSKYHHHYRTRR